MIIDFHEQQFPVHVRFWRLAMAYLDAAEAACLLVIQDAEKQTWPASSVVLLLEAHAVELFLKGAILVREPGAAPGFRTHNLNALRDRYFQLFPEVQFSFEVPFTGHVYLGFNEEELAELTRNEPSEEPHSMTYRYPVDRDGNARDGVRAMDPTQQLGNIRGLRDILNRLVAAISNP